MSLVMMKRHKGRFIALEERETETERETEGESGDLFAYTKTPLII